MIFVITWILGLAAGAAATLLNPSVRTFGEICRNLLFYQMTVTVALSGLIGFWGHVFRSDMVAEQIGWKTGSPFQKELGYAELGYAIAGLMCIWQGKEFWLAVIVLVSPLFFLAGLNHIREMIVDKNISAHNTATSIADLLMPVSWVLLWICAR